MIRQTLYNAYTKINPRERSILTKFLHEYATSADSKKILQAIEYALKEIPSFGGFILTAFREEEMIGAIVVNRSGLSDGKNIFVFVTLHPDFQASEDQVLKFMERAINYADGPVALQIAPDSPSLELYKKLGFEPQFLELRLTNKTTSAVA